MKKLIMIIPLVFLLCFTFACQQSKQKTEKGLSEEQVNALTGEVLKAWNNADMDACAKAYSPDIVFSDPLLGEIVGIDAFKEMIRSLHDERKSFNLSIDEVFIKGNKLAALWTDKETLPSGAEIETSGVSITTIKDGKIAKEILYFDTKKMLEQMGYKIIPPEEKEEK